MRTTRPINIRVSYVLEDEEVGWLRGLREQPKLSVMAQASSARVNARRTASWLATVISRRVCSIWTVPAPAATTVTTPRQVTLSEDNRTGILVVVASFDESTTQQLQINFHVSRRRATPRKLIGMNQMREQLCAFDD